MNKASDWIWYKDPNKNCDTCGGFGRIGIATCRCTHTYNPYLVAVCSVLLLAFFILAL